MLNKASMILEICSGLQIEYLPSMYRMSYKEVDILYESLFKIGLNLQQIKKAINTQNPKDMKKENK